MNEAKKEAPDNRPRSIRDMGIMVVMLAVLGSLNFLPPDSSLEEVERSGRLRVCMPDNYPPLVMNEPDRPGFDVELLRAVSERMGLAFSMVPNPAMARDFNPRSWRVTRAQCSVLAGGIALTSAVRSYLDTTSEYLATGWAVVSPTPLESLDGKRVGFFAGLTGLDRLVLSRALRGAGIRVTIVNRADDLAAQLESGELDAGISEALTVRQIADAQGWNVAWIGQNSERYPIGIGFWKADLTLKRAVSATLAELDTDGTIAALMDKYGIGDIEHVIEIGAAVPSAAGEAAQ